jgi:hypothetical protein
MNITKATVTAKNGVCIRLSEASFEFASALKKGRTLRPEITACTNAPSDLVTGAIALGGAPTSVGLLIDGNAVVAHVLVKGLGSIAGLVFDFGNPALWPWLNSARKSGYLPIALQGSTLTQIVHVSLTKSVMNLIERSRELRQLEPDEFATAVTLLVEEFSDAETVHELGFAAGRLKEATIGVCLSMESMAGRTEAADANGAVH